jgi:hypothetical protein
MANATSSMEPIGIVGSLSDARSIMRIASPDESHKLRSPFRRVTGKPSRSV